jgi:hypothetical protein
LSRLEHAVSSARDTPIISTIDDVRFIV